MRIHRAGSWIREKRARLHMLKYSKSRPSNVERFCSISLVSHHMTNIANIPYSIFYSRKDRFGRASKISMCDVASKCGKKQQIEEKHNPKFGVMSFEFHL